MFYPVSFTDEQWVELNIPPIKKNLYIISNYGNIKNKITNKYLSLCKDIYLYTQLMNEDNSRSTYKIHRLVALSFIPNNNPETQIFVNHMDLDKWNPHANNLEWVTPDENNQHAWINGAHDSDFDNNARFNQVEKTSNWGKGELSAGEKNGMSRLTEAQVHSICKNVEAGCSYVDALLNSGLPNTENNRFIVSHIVQGTKWKHVSSQYNIKQKLFMTDYTPYIEDVCKMLSDGYTTRQIINTLDIPGNDDKVSHFIGRVRRRQVYTEISDKYNW